MARRGARGNDKRVGVGKIRAREPFQKGDKYLCADVGIFEDIRVRGGKGTKSHSKGTRGG